MRSTGTLLYDPQAATIESKPWWLIVAACPDLARYYRDMLNRFHRGRLTVQRPAWDAHVSVVRAEAPPNPAAWGKYQGQPLEFDYDPDLLTNGVYYWLAVVCPRLGSIRAELGLDPTPTLPFHLTVAIDPEGEWLEGQSN